MNDTLKIVQEKIYNKCSLPITDYLEEIESKEYKASQFQLSDKSIICRDSKITPKKIGQFVTFWKRKDEGPIEPFRETDSFDFFVVNVKAGDKLGQFVFPISVLIKKGIISTSKKEGKRAIRVYPSWDTPLNATAIRTQKWQLDYFYELNPATDLEKVKALYDNK